MDADGTMRLTAYSYLEIAFIYAFTIFFDRSDIAPIFPIPFCTPKILEDALFTDTHDLLDQLMCSFLSNALNRKKLIEPSSSARPLNEYVNAKVRGQDFDLGYNPLSLQDGFKGLSPDLKLKILYALVEWQLQDSTAVRTIVDTLYTSIKKGQVNPLTPTPLGHDSQKRAYWQFGDSPYMWRERAHLKSGCEWEIVCRDLDDLRQFAGTMEQSKSHKEKKLAQHIKAQLVPGLEEKQKQQEIKDRAKARKMAALLALETPRELPRRARRKPARYNYSEEFMDLAADDEDVYVDHDEPTTMRRPTRSSGRLHGDDAIVSYMEDMDIDSQQPSSETNTSDLDIDEKDIATDSNDDDEVKGQHLLTKTWSTPESASPGFYEEIDETLDIV